MLWLAVHLPMFALETSQAGQDSQAPTVLVDDSRVVLGNQAALNAGIRPHSTLATAHGICPQLIHYRRDAGRERKRLRLLAEMCYRFTSRVSIEPPQGARVASGLLLEAGGSLRLFGDLSGWQSQVAALCRKLGHAPMLRAAATPSAALALARAGASRLNDVPLAHTELNKNDMESLFNMGIGTLGPLLQLPEAELGPRFGTGLTNYLQRLAGKAPDPRHCIEPTPVFASSLHLLDPITSKQALLFPMQRLLTELENWLIARQLGTARLLWHFTPHAAAGRVSLPVRFATARQRKAEFIEIVRLALNRATLPENVLEVGLRAQSLVSRTTHTQTLFEHPAHEQHAPTELIDRFTAQLGETACSGVAVTGEHIPERAWQRRQTSEGGDCPNGDSGINRPLWFFDSPLRIKREALEILNGPERLQTGWWVDEGRPHAGDTTAPPPTEPFAAENAAERSPAGSLHTKGVPSQGAYHRDYYMVRCGNGARGWAFVDADGQWFLHGYFG